MATKIELIEDTKNKRFIVERDGIIQYPSPIKFTDDFITGLTKAKALVYDVARECDCEVIIKFKDI